MIENDRAKIPWDFQIQTNKMVVSNQHDIVMVDKQDKKLGLVDVAILCDSKIRKKEHKMPEKYQGLKEELQRTWGLKWYQC